MSPEERLSKRDAETSELYRTIGEFVVSFEMVCHSLQHAITFLLHGAGLRNQQASSIILSGMTADPLCNVFQSLVGELTNLSDAERAIVKNLTSRFKTLNEDRNDIIHSTWFVGWGNEKTTDFSSATGYKHHRSKRGAGVKSFERTAQDFQLLAAEAKILGKAFIRLSGCISAGISIDKNFEVSPDGRVSLPTNA